MGEEGEIVIARKDLFAVAKAITLETRQRFVTLSEVEELLRLRICNLKYCNLIF